MFAKMELCLTYGRKENIVRKGELAGYHNIVISRLQGCLGVIHQMEKEF